MGGAGRAEEGGEGGYEGEEDGTVRQVRDIGVGDEGDVGLCGGEEEAGGKGVKVGGGLHSKHLKVLMLPFWFERSEI